MELLGHVKKALYYMSRCIQECRKGTVEYDQQQNLGVEEGAIFLLLRGN